MQKGLIIGALAVPDSLDNSEKLIDIIKDIDGVKEVNISNLRQYYITLCREHPQFEPFVDNTISEIREKIESTGSLVIAIDADVDDKFFE